MMVIVVVVNDYGGENSHDGDKSSYDGDINTSKFLGVPNILLGRSAVGMTTTLTTNYYFQD